MKKISVLVLFIITVLGLVGCGKKGETVTVLTSSGYEPYEMVGTDGKLTGFDIELMEALAHEVGIKIKWKDVDFDGIRASLQSGQAEIAIAGITPSPKRALYVDFSEIYYNSEDGLVNYFVSKSSNPIKSLEDLDGLVVGAQLGTVQANLISELASKYNFTVDLRNYNTQIVEEINAGRIDVLVVESLVAESILEVNDNLSKEIFDYTLDSKYGNAIAFTKGSEYVEEFNKAIVKLQENGKIDELVKKWFD
ncbi:transporter substrate-binding domain-containing protein [Mycoplasmatota bacterium]|nr:transporter substrate-binding domain-containing protein [Mycoplasmatota bacterium]